MFLFSPEPSVTAYCVCQYLLAVADDSGLNDLRPGGF
jgi:hypothetical protein